MRGQGQVRGQGGRWGKRRGCPAPARAELGGPPCPEPAGTGIEAATFFTLGTSRQVWGEKWGGKARLLARATCTL